tara:strand:+ start:5071 stop:5598 length:528 start_codon:yes stop_codon:yes gene_type:complete
MRLILIFLLILFLNSCSKPKAILICGDHVCINKDEAQQFFEENMSIEVKILDSKEKKEINLVELNLMKDTEKKKIVISKKDKIKRDIKILTNDEIEKKKLEINKKKIAKKVSSKVNTKKVFNKNIKKEKIINNGKNQEMFNICLYIEKDCSIEEISKYLLKKGNDKGFPDITLRN